MQFLKSANEVLFFLLELIMYFSIGYFGFQQGKSTFLKWVFACGLVLIAAILWGYLAAPKSQTKLDLPYRLVFELAMFLMAAFLLYKLNHASLALLFTALSIFTVAIAY